MKTSITFEIDTDNLSGYTDEHVAALWHVAQANPAKLGDRDACDLAEAVGYEIIRRWLKNAPANIYSHQARHFEWKGLQDVGAKFIDGRWQIPTDVTGSTA